MADAIIPKERADLALSATYEMEALIDAVKREIANDEASAAEVIVRRTPSCRVDLKR